MYALTDFHVLTGFFHRSARRPKSVDGSTPSLPFEDAVCSSSTHEVSRMFLAALQLTNEGNVDLSTTGNVDNGDLVLTVTMLKRERRKLELENDKQAANDQQVAQTAE